MTGTLALLLRNNKQLQRTLMTTPDLRFLWPMQETGGALAYDVTGHDRNGTYDGASLCRSGPNRRIPRSVSFNGSSNKVDAAAGCSLRGLGAFTWVGVIEFLSIDNQGVWFESPSDSATVSRIQLSINISRVLAVSIRSGLAAQAVSTVSLAAGASVGHHMVHATVDIAGNAIGIYIDGVSRATTGTANFGGDTIVADTAPLSAPRFGHAALAVPRWYPGQASHVGMYARVLSASECLAHAKAGGFA